MTIYVITNGTYSAYHIITATTDRDKALKIFKKLKAKKRIYDDDLKIEEYEDADIDTSLNLYCVYTQDGFIYSYSEQRTFYYDYAIKQTVVDEGVDSLTTYVLAATEKKARKIAEDRFAKFRAEEEGLV